LQRHPFLFSFKKKRYSGKRGALAIAQLLDTILHRYCATKSLEVTKKPSHSCKGLVSKSEAVLCLKALAVFF